MVDLKASCRPSITYRPILPSDLGILQQMHSDLFPIRYESEFFHNVVNRRGIVSWGAVDCSRPSPHNNELVGFVTVKVVLARESEISDLLSCDSSRSDQTLVYILTLGVVESYRNLGIASALIRRVVRYARTIQTCRGVYLHVISYNVQAIHLYDKMSFKCVRKLFGFYIIDGQHYDSYLFVYYVNGGRSPCSPLELAVSLINYMKTCMKFVAGRLCKNEERKAKRSAKCKESRCLLTLTPCQSKRNVAVEGASEYHSV